MRLIRSADYTRKPWKNGGGMLAEIIAFPEGAAMDTFDWRLSAAHVGQDGPFSLFPGIDRTIKILGGTAMRLEIAGQPPVILAPGSAPFDFPGDVATSAYLVDGPIDDLNIMVRRGRCLARTRQQHLSGATDLTPPAGGVTLVYVERGSVAATCKTLSHTAEAGDTLVLDEAVTLSAASPATVCVIEISPA